MDHSIPVDFIDKYCQKVKERKISSWKAAEILKISLREMMAELKKREISSYSEEALEQDIQFMNHEKINTTTSKME